MINNKIFSNKAIIVCAMFSIFLSGCVHSVLLTVPEYSEEALDWCGPATGQMIMEAYPTGGCIIPQEDVWTSILIEKTETMWNTDPEGLKQTMIDSCTPTGTWIIYDDTDSTDLMHTVASLMTKYKYPVAAVLNTMPHNSVSAHSEHWVTIRGIVTDKDPTTNSTVDLIAVWLNDPAPATFGDPAVVRFISGSSWYSEFTRVSKTGSSYLDKFVVICEPPETKGKAIAHVEKTTGEIISPDQAVAFAKTFIKVHKLTKMKAYSSLKNARPSEPLLVNKKRKAYYIVPFIYEEKRELCEVAMLINAYDGTMKEVGAFKPVRYLAEKEAIQIAMESFRVKTADRIESELVTPPGYDHNEYFPLYKVQMDNKTLYVNREGKTFSSLRYPKQDR